MPRPRKYATNAERQAAHRQRLTTETARVNREALEALIQAIENAAAAGDEEARKVRTGTVDALLKNLAHLFEARAGERR